jgi:hypothetical protein
MRPLLALSARASAAAGAIVLGVGVAAGAIRLLPWLVAPGVPLELATPFVRTLLLGASEMTILVALPLGAAVAAALFVERGEARALAALGVSPARFVKSLVAPGLLVVALYAAFAASSYTEPPGLLAARLIEEGRASCAEAKEPRRVDVPLVLLSWLCFREGPRLTGRLPGVVREVWFTASEVGLDGDLRSLSARDLHLATRQDSRTLTLHVGDARVKGLHGWGRAKAVTGLVRAAFVGGAALFAALFAVWSVVRVGRPGPVAAGVLSALAAAGMALVLSRLDAREAPTALYLALPATGIAVLWAAFLLAERISGRFVAGRNLQ